MPAGQQTVRRHNLSLVSRAVAEAPSSRAELAQRTGLTKATVSSLVDALLARGLLVEGAAPSARVGRPARPVSLNPDGPVALGIEINVDYIGGCLLDLHRYRACAADGSARWTTGQPPTGGDPGTLVELCRASCCDQFGPR